MWPQEEFFMKKWWIAAVILLALLIAGYWGGYYHPEDWLGMKSPEPKALSEKVVPVPPGSFQGPPQGYDPRYVRSEPARFGRIPMIIPITGKLAYDAKSIYLASARVAGRLDRILVFEGGAGGEKTSPCRTVQSGVCVGSEGIPVGQADHALHEGSWQQTRTA